MRVLPGILFVLASCAGVSRGRQPVRTVYVSDCGHQVAVDQGANGNLYLKGTDIPFRYGENCG